MTKIKGLVLKNYQVKITHSLLFTDSTNKKPLFLHGVQARARNKFFQIIEPHINYIESERIKIITTYAKKEKGDKVMTNEKGEVEWLKGGLEGFKKEYNVLINKEFVIDVIPSNRETLKQVRDILLNLKTEFSPVEGRAYDLICQSFERI